MGGDKEGKGRKGYEALRRSNTAALMRYGYIAIYKRMEEKYSEKMKGTIDGGTRKRKRGRGWPLD